MIVCSVRKFDATERFVPAHDAPTETEKSVDPQQLKFRHGKPIVQALHERGMRARDTQTNAQYDYIQKNRKADSPKHAKHTNLFAVKPSLFRIRGVGTPDRHDDRQQGEQYEIVEKQEST
jgi:hypothetical protein